MDIYIYKSPVSDAALLICAQEHFSTSTDRVGCEHRLPRSDTSLGGGKAPLWRSKSVMFQRPCLVEVEVVHLQLDKTAKDSSPTSKPSPPPSLHKMGMWGRQVAIQGGVRGTAARRQYISARLSLQLHISDRPRHFCSNEAEKHTDTQNRQNKSHSPTLKETMDPLEFGISTLPLQHAPYPAIARETLAGANAGKVALVTGAQRGIGAAIAEALAASGADLALLDLSAEKLDATRRTCEALGVRVRTYVCDVTDETRVKEVVGKVEEELGPVE